MLVSKVIKRILSGSKMQKIYKIIFKIVGELPKKSSLVVFESFHGKQYSDSPRAIFEYMSENTPNAQLVWSVDRRHTKLFEGLNIPYIKRFTIKWFLTMPRAKYWVNNVRLPNWLPKPKKTEYVQTWHGTPLKRLGVDIKEIHMPGTDTGRYKRNFITESSNWDYLVSPNAYSTEIFTRAFSFNGQVLETGYPRNDFLYNYTQRDVSVVKEQLNIPKDKKVILYAPTWRDNQFYSVGQYKFDIKLDLNRMKEQLGNEYVILLRMHYLISENIDLTEYEGFAYDVSNYLDIRELYVISDILITDYSSVFFDFANLKRPIIFYVYDLDEYRDHLRGFYFDLEQEAPGPLVKNTEQVISHIQAVSKDNDLSVSYQQFYSTFCGIEDGEASKRVVEAFYNDK
ncbi:CDP-glycerol glycerophosphotransferase [Alkalibacillus filiformis]|uniref:CDP-glycerol glycerophosphotransferase n=1 Tax=Alkalibacillus filiformis TaxID=200990 RepID=A0ABU0DWY3_9BACI|nr:CDP-glycerol glycerophosphotransferase family protein [Alkalibacillus filiformis]MDQ0352781.1 CDP-glycerol glycerophosphotransferase [Alkalibacillus filiformis]